MNENSAPSPQPCRHSAEPVRSATETGSTDWWARYRKSLLLMGSVDPARPKDSPYGWFPHLCGMPHEMLSEKAPSNKDYQKAL